MMIDQDSMFEWDGPLLPLEDVDFAEMIEHGTLRGYEQHRRWGVTNCSACLEAKRTYNKESKRLRREARKVGRA